MTTLTIHGRKYEVEQRIDPDPKGGVVYYLTGARGGLYFTMRYDKHPECMFVIGNTGSILKGAELTDKNGNLEVR